MKTAIQKLLTAIALALSSPAFLVMADGQPGVPQVSMANMPLGFIENRGQTDAKVGYYAHGRDGIFFSSEGVTFAILEEDSSSPAGHHARRGRSIDPSPGHNRKRWSLKLDFVEANPKAHPQGMDPLPGVVSYFKGRPEKWKTGLKSHASVVYSELWPGIDVKFSGEGGGLKYMYTIKPGADPNQIRLSVRGAATLSINANGQIEFATPLVTLLDEKPTAYQEINGQRIPIAIDYALDAVPNGGNGNHQVAKGYHFNIGQYDHSQPLVIDPVVLIYARIIGGSSGERGLGIAVDATGNAYVVGETISGDFPGVAGPDPTYNGDIDAYIMKLNPDGTSFVYSGYIGGAQGDGAFAVAVDNAGAAYVCGFTGSDEATFPVVGGPDLHFHGGVVFGTTGIDAFIAKVDPTGTSLSYCGYVGGAGDEAAENIAVDAGGNAYLTGYTTSPEDSFPVVVGPDLTQNGRWDTFVAKVKANPTDPVAKNNFAYCGYIGGAGDDAGVFYDQNGNFSAVTGGSIALDGAGNAYVCSFTASDQNTFPNGQGFGAIPGFDKTYNGGAYDAFVAKVKADGSGLTYCSYLGGAGEEGANGIGVDANGNAYVCGYTSSSEATFPVIGGPDLHFHGGTPPLVDGDAAADAFVAKLNAAGTALVYCGYIGGLRDDTATNMRVDSNGTAYIVGQTESASNTFPVVNGPNSIFNGGQLSSFFGGHDGFVAKLKPTPTDAVVTNNYEYCGYIGGNGFDAGFDIAFDGQGNAYVCGDFFGVSGGFVAKIGSAPPAPLNDDFNNALVITSLPFTSSANITSATTASDDPVLVTNDYYGQKTNVQGRTVWYTFTQTANKTIVATLDYPAAGLDRFGTSNLVLYTGTRGALNVVPPSTQCNNTKVYNLQAGVIYYFMIGFNCSASDCGGIGNVTLLVHERIPPANDDFDQATTINSIPFAQTINVVDATLASDDPNDGFGFIRWSTVWYRLSVGTTMDVAIETSDSDFPLAFSVYTGARGNLTRVPGNDYPCANQFRMHALANATYYIMVVNNKFCPTSANLGLSIRQVAAPPSNDDFDHALVIPSVPFVSTINVSEATSAPDDPANLFFRSSVPTVWYQFTPPTDMDLAVDTPNGSYASIVTIFTGSRGALSNVASRAALSCPLKFHAVAGITYHLLVASYYLCPGGTLDFTLHRVNPPANDDFDRATIVDSVPYANVVDLGNATRAADDPNDIPLGAPFPTAWYQFTPVIDMDVSAELLVSDSSALREGLGLFVYSGTRGALTKVAPADFQCLDLTVTFHAVAGVTYYLMAADGSFCSQDGQVTLSVRQKAGTAANDDFDNATIIASLPFSNSFNLADATHASDDPTNSLFINEDLAYPQGGPTVWYRYTPTVDTDIIADNAGGNFLVIFVYTGARGSLTNVAVNTSSSFCAFGPLRPLRLHTFAGVTYYFMVTDFTFCPVDLVFSLRRNDGTVPGNDDFAHPTIIRSLPFRDALSTTNATLSADDPVPSPYSGCGFVQPFGEGHRATVWYLLTPTLNMRIEANTLGSDYDTALTVWTKSTDLNFPGLTPITCNDDYFLCCSKDNWQSNPNCGAPILESRVRVDVQAGVTYLFMVGDLDFCGRGGQLAFSIMELPPPTPPIGITVNANAVLGKDGSVTLSGTLTCANHGPGVIQFFVQQPIGGQLFCYGGQCRLQTTDILSFDCKPTEWSLTTFVNPPGSKSDNRYKHYGVLSSGPADVFAAGYVYDPATCDYISFGDNPNYPISTRVTIRPAKK